MMIPQENLISSNQVLRRKIEMLLEALEFYRNGHHYRIVKMEDGSHQTGLLDPGAIAQFAIDAIGKPPAELAEWHDHLKVQIQEGTFEEEVDS